MRHQCYFTQSACPVVGADQTVKYVFARGGARLDNPTVFKAHRNVFDQSALMGQGFRGPHGSVDAIFMWSCKTLFGRNVRLAVDTVSSRRSSACPQMVLRQTDGQIGSRSSKVQCVKPFRI